MTEPWTDVTVSELELLAELIMKQVITRLPFIDSSTGRCDVIKQWLETHTHTHTGGLAHLWTHPPPHTLSHAVFFSLLLRAQYKHS